jgi:hypothetical protein
LIAPASLIWHGTTGSCLRGLTRMRGILLLRSCWPVRSSLPESVVPVAVARDGSAHWHQLYRAFKKSAEHFQVRHIRLGVVDLQQVVVFCDVSWLLSGSGSRSEMTDAARDISNSYASVAGFTYS